MDTPMPLMDLLSDLLNMLEVSKEEFLAVHLLIPSDKDREELICMIADVMITNDEENEILYPGISEIIDMALSIKRKKKGQPTSSSYDYASGYDEACEDIESSDDVW